jgi:hypothetical protein
VRAVRELGTEIQEGTFPEELPQIAREATYSIKSFLGWMAEKDMELGG